MTPTSPSRSRSRAKPEQAAAGTDAPAEPLDPTLFEYQVIDDNGVLVIRVGGSLIARALTPLREQAAEGPTSLSALMSPLSFLGSLLSPAVGVDVSFQPDPTAFGGASQGVAVSRPDWLGQELAQTFEEFQDQAREFRQALEEIKGEMHADDTEQEPKQAAKAK